ncbi:MAG: isoprenylcysteine carboxylmethyltransferase family protein [Phaeodactylibacter sp.]|uniref:methyltransferase family protein n=1 Tax=Phaeodactylibacter sp. TaxID=1940289 RepID=UPI0032EFBAB4
MGKIKNTALFLLLAYVLPLAFRPSLLLDYRILFLMLAAVAVFLTQPGFEVEEAERDRSADNNSVLFILVLSVLAIAIPVIEWGYFHPDRVHLHWIMAGALIVIAGTGLRIWAIQTLGRFFTATVQIQEEHQLIQHGPFRYIRHPSYTGALLTAVGGAIVLESWLGLLIATACMLYAYYVRITAEETALVSKFGQRYLDYQKQSSRLIPGIW